MGKGQHLIYGAVLYLLKLFTLVKFIHAPPGHKSWEKNIWSILVIERQLVQSFYMTTPMTSMSTAQSTFYNAVTGPSGPNPVVNTAAPGAVQAGINYGALITALADFGLVTADAVNVFAQDFQAIINEALSAGILATSIVGAIEGAIPKPAG